MAARARSAAIAPGQVVGWLMVAGAGVAVVAGVAALYNLTESWWADGAGDDVPMPDGQEPTLDDSRLSLIAERIYAGLWEGWLFYEDEEDMAAAVLELGNDADMARLFNIYGIRRGPFMPDAALNLVQSFHVAFNDEELANLNAALAAKGITYLL